jgi:hypothetical protein
MQSAHPPSVFSGLVTYLLASFDALTSQLYQDTMVQRLRDVLLMGSVTYQVVAQPNCSQSSVPVDLTWHPPNDTNINNLEYVVNGTGIDGFIFNSSTTPASTSYSTYNWCNMPHVRAKEYPLVSAEYTLEYVEIVCSDLFFAIHFLTFARSTATTSGPHTRPTPFRASPTPGTATTKRCSTMASRNLMDPRLR